jgi:hypothetical protein
MKAKPEQVMQKSQIDSKTHLSRARVVGRTPKSIQLTDHLLQSFRKKLKGMTTDNLREKRERSF